MVRTSGAPPGHVALARFPKGTLPLCCVHPDRCTSASADREQEGCEATRHGCLLRGVAGTEHVNHRARLCDLLSCPPACAAASCGTDTVGWEMEGSERSQALCSSKNFYKIEIVLLSLVFNKYYPIMY